MTCCTFGSNSMMSLHSTIAQPAECQRCATKQGCRPGSELGSFGPPSCCRIGQYQEGEELGDAAEFAGRVFSTVYMGTENSSAETRQRAATLAKQVVLLQLWCCWRQSEQPDSQLEAVRLTARGTGWRSRAGCHAPKSTRPNETRLHS